MIAIEHVAADHQKDETGKMSRCQEKSWWDELKHLYWYRTKARQTLQGTGCKKMYEGNRVAEREWGKERKDAKNVGCEDVKWTRFYTDTFTHRRSYADTLLHTDAFTHRSPYTQTLGHNKACTKYGECTSQCYFVLQSLHKHFPVLQLCTKHFPVLLCTTKVAHGTSQHYSVQVYYKACTKMHKVLPSTTLYYKACTKYVPTLGPSAV